jgi:hypothetical protein
MASKMLNTSVEEYRWLSNYLKRVKYSGFEINICVSELRDHTKQKLRISSDILIGKTPFGFRQSAFSGQKVEEMSYLLSYYNPSASNPLDPDFSGKGRQCGIFIGFAMVLICQISFKNLKSQFSNLLFRNRQINLSFADNC